MYHHHHYHHILTRHSENGGTPLTFKEVRDFTSNIRKTISNRRLIKQSFVVNVGDSLGRTGQVAWEAKISGIIDGVDAIGSIVSVAQIIFAKDTAEVGGHRQILMKNNVFVIHKASFQLANIPAKRRHEN